MRTEAARNYGLNPTSNWEDWRTVMDMSALGGISDWLWETSTYDERLGLLEEWVNTHGSLAASMGLGTAPVLLSETKRIFTEYPANLSYEWDFTRSPVTEKGGPTKPLAKLLVDKGLTYDQSRLRPIPDASDLDRSKPTVTLNKSNATLAEDVVAEEWRRKGHRIEQLVLHQTPHGTRTVDIVATKNAGAIPINQKNALWKSSKVDRLQRLKSRRKWGKMLPYWQSTTAMHPSLSSSDECFTVSAMSCDRLAWH